MQGVAAGTARAAELLFANFYDSLYHFHMENLKINEILSQPEKEGKYSFLAHEIKDSDLETTLLVLSSENAEDPERNIIIAVSPEYGSNLMQFKVGDKDIFYTDKELLKDRRWTGCYVLWPLPNRYDMNGTKGYEFEGQTVSLEDVERKEGNKPLIHGLVDDQVWQYEQPEVTDEGVSMKTRIEITKDSPLYAHFPYESELTLQYTVTKDGVEVTYTAVNRGEQNMPSTFALHPYYKLLDGREGTRVRVPARSIMEATEDLLPTGKLLNVEGTAYDLREPKPVKDMMFDDVWTDLEPGEDAYVEYADSKMRIRQKTTDDFTHVVLYTQKESDLGFICLEPQTGSTNSINLDNQAKKQDDEQLKHAAHLIVVPPGESHVGKVKFAVEMLG